ncbi:condensation domain-containing protein [Micromonospora sp. B11E3]|uniref:condensation domain-containing protein n=1 Tax=Micromonospora sp. B11E3 TaxID=3153562 RepID=UPI00325EBF87
MTGAPADVDGLLRLLRARGVVLAARGTALDFDAPAGALTDDLIDAMRRLKPDILRRLAGDAGEVACTAPAVPPHRLDAAVEDFCAAPFGLEAEPAFRALLARVDDPADPGRRHELALAVHHGIVDGWSVEVLVRDLGELYRAAQTGQPADLPPLAADFVDFCRWERDLLAAPSTRDMVRAWADRVRPHVTPIRLPTDRPRGASRSTAGAYVTEVVPTDLLDAATGYALRRNVTPFVVFAAAFAVLVREVTGASTVPLTSAVANRADPRFADVVGVFTQSPWLVVELRGARTFDDAVARTAAATWEMLAMQSVPGQVQTEALGEAFAGSPPRVYLAMLDMPDPVLRLPGLAPAPARDVPLAGARADQLWYLRGTDDGGLSLTVEYATALFDAATVTRSVARYRALLRRALAEPDAWPGPDPA